MDIIKDRLEIKENENKDRKDTLAIVFWNPTNISKAATSLHIVEGKTNPSQLDIRIGMGIKDFFKNEGIKIEDYIQEFPDCVEFAEPTERPSWDSAFKWLSLPENNEDGLQRLADLLDMPIEAYIYEKGKDKNPRLNFRLEPSIDAGPKEAHYLK